MRVPIIGGNWKMNTTIAEAVALARSVSANLAGVDDVQVFVCPPFTSLRAVTEVLAASRVQLGAQDVFWEDWGAFTGEISAPMLLDAGAAWVIVGHSERRHILGESSETVNRKAHCALASGLGVIVAVGETREERRAGATEHVLDDQLAGSLADLNAVNMENVVIAYEPVWAIGTGETATPEQAQRTHAFIRERLGQLFDEATAEAIRIQYGGSVTSANAAELLDEADIDGALVGGASLKSDQFTAIVRCATGGG